jgi:transcription antitermination factor NusG
MCHKRRHSNIEIRSVLASGAEDKQVGVLLPRDYKRGDRVVVLTGPFADLDGVVVASTAEVVVIELEVFGRAVTMRYPVDQLRPRE